MGLLLWILIVVAVLAVLAVGFAVIRMRQRQGDVLASRPASDSGGTS